MKSTLIVMVGSRALTGFLLEMPAVVAQANNMGELREKIDRYKKLYLDYTTRR